MRASNPAWGLQHHPHTPCAHALNTIGTTAARRLLVTPPTAWRPLPSTTPRITMAPAAANSTAATATPVAAEPKAPPKVINRLDYKAPPYLIDQVHLNFVLNEDVSTVESTLTMKPNYAGATPPPLELQGAVGPYLAFGSLTHAPGHPDVELLSVKINDAEVPASDYTRTPTALTLDRPPAGDYVLRIVVNIKPQENTALEGLYKSSGNYCTQCEAQGFRHITYFLDRPDVMAKYTTRIEADRAAYPVLLGNGNLVQQGDLEAGRCVVVANLTRCRHVVSYTCPIYHVSSSVAGTLLCGKTHGPSRATCLRWWPATWRSRRTRL